VTSLEQVNPCTLQKTYLNTHQITLQGATVLPSIGVVFISHRLFTEHTADSRCVNNFLRAIDSMQPAVEPVTPWASAWHYEPVTPTSTYNKQL